MIITNQMRRALDRLRQGPCLAYDIGVAALGPEALNGNREAIGRRGHRIAAKLKAAGLAKSGGKLGLTAYGITGRGMNS